MFSIMLVLFNACIKYQILLLPLLFDEMSLYFSRILSLSVLFDSLARSQHYSDGLFEIFRQYGDHLYRLVATILTTI